MRVIWFLGENGELREYLGFIGAGGISSGWSVVALVELDWIRAPC